MFFNETKELMVRLISEHQPVSARELFYKIKTKKHITYQAIFKTIQELVEKGVLCKRDRYYELNKAWLTQVYEFTHTLLKINGLSPLDVFVKNIGPKVLEHIKNKSSCIIGITPGGGRLYGQCLTEYLRQQNANVSYAEMGRNGEITNDSILKDKTCIVVDHGTYTGSTYTIVMKKLRKTLAEEQLSQVKFVVERDHAKLADFYVER
jgi:hypothetical protein